MAHHRFIKRQLDIEQTIMTPVLPFFRTQTMRTFKGEDSGAADVIEGAEQVEGRRNCSTFVLYLKKLDMRQ